MNNSGNLKMKLKLMLIFHLTEVHLVNQTFSCSAVKYLQGKT